MLRELTVVALLAAGCAAAEEKQTWGALACSGEVQGQLATRTWCDGEWRTWHAEDQAASAGRIEGGVHLPAHTMWWPDGTVASDVRDGVQRMFDEAGTELGQTPVDDQARWSLPCPPSAGRHEGTGASGNQKVWCGSEDGTVDGRLTTYYADGSVESVQHYIAGKRHGPFEAYHAAGDAGAVGAVWVRGAYAADKKHGPWLSWDTDGQVYQPSVDPVWRDHKAVPTWVSQTAGSGS